MSTLANEDTTNEVSQIQQNTQSTLSIATPLITASLPFAANLNDNSFMLPLTPSSCKGSDPSCERYSLEKPEKELDDLSNGQIVGTIEIPADSSISVPIQPQMQTDSHADSQLQAEEIEGESGKNVAQDSDGKVSRKRAKLSKKSSKLDAKSKLEKSRQSARECRARKKLRYQYLEDLVNNREKAVVKLRKQLTMVG